MRVQPHWIKQSYTYLHRSFDQSLGDTLEGSCKLPHRLNLCRNGYNLHCFWHIYALKQTAVNTHDRIKQYYLISYQVCMNAGLLLIKIRYCIHICMSQVY